MKKQKKEIAGMMIEAAGKIAQLVAHASFEFWQRKDFQLYVDFDNLTQTEQDRMFNELEVSLLGLFLLYFENAQTELEKPEAMVLSLFQRELIPAFLKIMEDAGIEKVYLQQWEKLIDMRLREYREDLKTALEESKDEKELQNNTSLHKTWAVIETITIDCWTHIRRGDAKEEDPLWKLLRKWFTMQYAQLSQLTLLAESQQRN